MIIFVFFRIAGITCQYNGLNVNNKYKKIHKAYIVYLKYSRRRLLRLRIYDQPLIMTRGDMTERANELVQAILAR